MLDRLTEDEISRLSDMALLFLHHKKLEPVQSLVLDAPMRLIIALQACLPVLELGLDWYRGWYSVVVYPDAFRTRHQQMDEAGVVWEDSEVLSGESWTQGPVILSWADIRRGMALNGYNVIIHELAHKIDLCDGAANGRPPLHHDMSGESWTRNWLSAYADHCDRVRAELDTSLDPYGAESPAEFFAVLSEAFFELPGILREQYPEIYEELKRFYRQDPWARVTEQ